MNEFNFNNLQAYVKSEVSLRGTFVSGVHYERFQEWTTEKSLLYISFLIKGLFFCNIVEIDKNAEFVSF